MLQHTLFNCPATRIDVECCDFWTVLSVYVRPAVIFCSEQWTIQVEATIQTAYITM